MTTLRESLMKAAEFDYTRYTNYSPHWVAGAISESSRLKNLITALIDCVVEQRVALTTYTTAMPYQIAFNDIREKWAKEALKATDEKLKPWLNDISRIE